MCLRFCGTCTNQILSYFVFQTKYLVSPSFLGDIASFAANASASAMHTDPTVIYAIPKKLFLPPKNEVVEMTRDFFPAKLSTTKRASMLNSMVVPALRSWSILPYSFRNFGRPAVRIHTMKCSSRIPQYLGFLVVPIGQFWPFQAGMFVG